MKSLHYILKTDFCAEQPRTNVASERDWFSWLLAHQYDLDAIPVLLQYAEALQTIGVELTNADLVDAVAGYLCSLEDAILVTLAKKDLEKPTAYLMAALRGKWKSRGRTQPYLPIRTAADFAPPLVAPTPAPSRSIPQLQAELDKGGVWASVIRSMLKHNPQWELSIVGGRLHGRLTEDAYELEEVPF